MSSSSSNSQNTSTNTNSNTNTDMSLRTSHYGGLQIGLAERPGPGLQPINKDKKKSSSSSSSKMHQQPQSLERKGLNQMINGILHNKRQHDAQVRAAAKAAGLDSETASLASVYTESQSLLKEKPNDGNSSGSKSKSSKLAGPNETTMSSLRFWH